ncbi:MAG: hypothetical protein M1381_11590 [Deltaproteobacteria bacterium]|nr:hypothetical protein [Deltaproteobacteria bacterium]
MEIKHKSNIFTIIVLFVTAANLYANELKSVKISGSFPTTAVFSMSEADIRDGEFQYAIRNSEDYKTMIIEGIGIINAPTQNVYKILVDFDSYKEWMPTIRYSHVKDEVNGITTVDLKHSMPFVGKFDCQQKYRITEKDKSEKVIDYYTTLCVFGPSNGRYCIQPAQEPEKTVLKYYQEISPSRFIPNFILKIIAKKGAKDTIKALKKRLREVQ